MNQLNPNIHIENFDEDYYCSDSESSGSEIESELKSSSPESEDENGYSNNVPPMVMGTDTPNDFISAFSDFLRQTSPQNNIISVYLSQELARSSMEGWYSTDLTRPERAERRFA